MPEWWATWYQPALAVLHVLGIAWFGATVLIDARGLRRIGLAWMLATGALLFAANSSHIAASTSFRVKLALLVALMVVRRPRWAVLTLWVAVIFASRGIAYF